MPRELVKAMSRRIVWIISELISLGLLVGTQKYEDIWATVMIVLVLLHIGAQRYLARSVDIDALQAVLADARRDPSHGLHPYTLGLKDIVILEKWKGLLAEYHGLVQKKWSKATDLEAVLLLAYYKISELNQYS